MQLHMFMLIWAQNKNFLIERFGPEIRKHHAKWKIAWRVLFNLL